jgi:hypothetical protein
MEFLHFLWELLLLLSALVVALVTFIGFFACVAIASSSIEEEEDDYYQFILGAVACGFICFLSGGYVLFKIYCAIT